MSWLCVLLTQLAACASTQQSMVIPYDVYLDVSAKVNPNEQGLPSPILVEVYELKSDDTFNTADFVALQDRPKELLGADLVSVEQMILRPGEHRRFSRPGTGIARRIGIVAGYRKLDQVQWRISYPLPGTKSTNLYKFWQSSPQRKFIRISVGQSGLAVGKSNQ